MPESTTTTPNAAPDPQPANTSQGQPDSLPPPFTGLAPAAAAERAAALYRAMQAQGLDGQSYNAQPAPAPDPYAQRFAQQLAGQARTLSQMREPRVWQKFGAEIEALISTVPAEARTPDAYAMVSDAIKGRHFNELASEYAAERLATMTNDSPLRSGTAPPVSGAAPDANRSLDLEDVELPPETAKMLRRHNVSGATLDEYLLAVEIPARRRRGETVTLAQARQEWLARAQRGDVALEPRSTRVGED